MNGPNWERVLKVDPQSRLLKGKWTDKVPELGHQSFVRSSVFCQWAVHSKVDNLR